MGCMILNDDRLFVGFVTFGGRLPPRSNGEQRVSHEKAQRTQKDYGLPNAKRTSNSAGSVAG